MNNFILFLFTIFFYNLLNAGLDTSLKNTNKLTSQSCEYEINLDFDKSNLTSEEILILQDLEFQKMLAALDESCIVKKSRTKNKKNISKNGDLILGQEVGDINSKTEMQNYDPSLGYQALSDQKIENNIINDSQILKSYSGNIPDCIRTHKDNDEVSVILKEAIAIEKNETAKQNLLKRYAEYNNLDQEKLKCITK